VANGSETAGMSGASTENVDKATAIAAGRDRGNGELFGGVGVALVTIFDPAGTADPAATARLAAELAARGMRAVLVAGTTGEAGTLTHDERVALIGAVRAAVPAEVPVIAGTGAATTEEAVGLTKAAAAAGADAMLAFPPPAPGVEPAAVDPAAVDSAGRGAGAYAARLADYYGAVGGAAGGRPVLAYHVPWISAPGVPVADLPGLPIAGIKDSSGSADRLLDELAHYEGATYVGSSALLSLAGPMSGAGAILALANVEPERCCRAFAGEAAVQRDLADVHLAVRAGGPAELKRMLHRVAGYCDLSRVA
jgi:4-hydroxy-tetrahydrodipicolinate synthase